MPRPRKNAGWSLAKKTFLKKKKKRTPPPRASSDSDSDDELVSIESESKSYELPDENQTLEELTPANGRQLEFPAGVPAEVIRSVEERLKQLPFETPGCTLPLLSTRALIQHLRSIWSWRRSCRHEAMGCSPAT